MSYESTLVQHYNGVKKRLVKPETLPAMTVPMAYCPYCGARKPQWALSPSSPEMKHIIEAVCEYYAVRRVDLMSRRRTALLQEPRLVAMYVMREHTLASLPEIGKFMAGRDHTTVLHAWQRISARIIGEPILAQRVAEVEVALGVVP